MNKLIIAILTALSLVATFAADKPVKVIFDTDMYTDFDDAGALACLHALAESDVMDNPVADVFRGNIPTREEIAKNAGSHLRTCNGMGGRAAWDETAVLVAVRGVDSYFNVHRGTFRMVGSQGENEWLPDEANGPHLRITEKVNKLEVAMVIDDLMCRKPLMK